MMSIISSLALGRSFGLLWLRLRLRLHMPECRERERDREEGLFVRCFADLSIRESFMYLAFDFHCLCAWLLYKCHLFVNCLSHID